MKPGDSKGLFAYTPMLHARMFKETAKYRDQHFQPRRSGLPSLPDTTQPPRDADYLDGRRGIDRPLTVQFCANDPDELLEAAKYVQPYCDAVDLNLGCPQGIARKGKYGAFLQEDWDLVYKLINTLHTNLDVPVTAKIRILETKEKTLEYAKTILSAGASILSVHGRQRDQKGHNTGLADWSVIRYLRKHLPPETVLFANGNVLRHEDIARCLAETGADGVMSAEGNLHDPTIFAAPPPPDSSDRLYWRGRNGKGGYRIDAVFRRYLSIIYKHVLEAPEPARAPLFLPSDSTPQADLEPSDSQDCGPDLQPPPKRQKRDKQSRPTSPNLGAMQAHLFSLMRPLITVHTEVRDALARSRGGDVDAFENVLALTERAVKKGLLEYEAQPEKYEDVEEGGQEIGAGTDTEDTTDHESSLRAVRACKRPWWVCQPYVRPLPKEAVEKGSIQIGKKEKRRLEMEAAREKSDQVTRDEGLNDGEKVDLRDGMKREDVGAQAKVCG